MFKSVYTIRVMTPPRISRAVKQRNSFLTENPCCFCYLSLLSLVHKLRTVPIVIK